ncbi:lysosome-associated membrane glycoprotein 1 [Copidosoma floridanum]|uniref:lysosome-associated membrane glycoprotein 1 n=1 Tax=Copidosoma floridanum TaxID=29053 RepID=UPI0006C9BBE4|nr:lysosome-associated membrane glycoprotein 1 [Copidosoma floridanum]
MGLFRVVGAVLVLMVISTDEVVEALTIRGSSKQFEDPDVDMNLTLFMLPPSMSSENIEKENQTLPEVGDANNTESDVTEGNDLTTPETAVLLDFKNASTTISPTDIVESSSQRIVISEEKMENETSDDTNLPLAGEATNPPELLYNTTELTADVDSVGKLDIAGGINDTLPNSDNSTLPDPSSDAVTDIIDTIDNSSITEKNLTDNSVDINSVTSTESSETTTTFNSEPTELESDDNPQTEVPTGLTNSSVEMPINQPTVVSTNASVRHNFKYLVSKDANVFCILASMNVSFRVPYRTVDNKIVTKEIQIPMSNVTVSGDCGFNGTSASMTLAWKGSQNSSDNSSITFQITHDHKVFYVERVYVTIFLDEDNFPNSTDIVITGNKTKNHSIKLFSASMNSGIYTCNSLVKISCGDIDVLMNNVSLIAYNDKQDVFTHRKEEQCTNTTMLADMWISIIIMGIIVCMIVSTMMICYRLRKRKNHPRSELPD